MNTVVEDMKVIEPDTAIYVVWTACDNEYDKIEVATLANSMEHSKVMYKRFKEDPMSVQLLIAYLFTKKRGYPAKFDPATRSGKPEVLAIELVAPAIPHHIWTDVTNSPLRVTTQTKFSVIPCGKDETATQISSILERTKRVNMFYSGTVWKRPTTDVAIGFAYAKGILLNLRDMFLQLAGDDTTTATDSLTSHVEDAHQNINQDNNLPLRVNAKGNVHNMLDIPVIFVMTYGDDAIELEEYHSKIVNKTIETVEIQGVTVTPYFGEHVS